MSTPTFLLEKRKVGKRKPSLLVMCFKFEFVGMFIAAENVNLAFPSGEGGPRSGG